MKKLLSLMMAFLLIVVGITPVNATETNTILNSQTKEIAIEKLNEDPNTVQVKMTEQEFVDTLKKQGYSVEKQSVKTAYRGEARASTYKVTRPLKQRGAPQNSGYISGNHFLVATYNTFDGWRYFVQFIGAGVELFSSGYGKESEQSNFSWTHGKQGVTWHTALQYTYTTSSSISVGNDWFGVGIGSSYIYRTPVVTESSSFNFPLVG